MNRKKIVALLAAGLLTFNTLSAISDVNVYANSVETFKLMTEEEIPQSQMTAVATTFQSGEDGSKAIDGDINTMWHTPWYETIEFPQSLTIDLGGANSISSLKISPRVSGANGMINNYEIYAINGETETLVSKGTWSTNNSDPKYVSFNKPVNAEKIKISALGGAGGFASIAEVNVYRVKGEANKIARYENKKITNNQGIDISSDVEALKGLEEGTIIARFDTTKGDIQSLISIGNNTVANGHFNLYVADNKIGFEVRNQSGNVATGSASAVLNKGINTVALKVTSGVGYKIFINGKLAGEVSSSNATLSAGVVDVNNAYIGRTDRSSGNEYLFNGFIDFIDVYGDALTDKYLLDITGQTVLPSEEEILPEGMKSEPIDLFKPGDLGSPNFRIPALFTTNTGTVIASIDIRNKGASDAPWNDIDSGIRRKTVDGEWEEAQRVIDFPGGASVIDTSLTQDAETGRIFLLVTTFPQDYGFWQAQSGSGYTDIDGVKYRSLYDASGNLYTIREDGNVYDSEGNITTYNVNVHSMELTKDGASVGNVMNKSCELQVYGTSYLSLIYSDDDGETWSEPIDINPDVKADWMKFLGTGPGAGIQIKNGEYKGRIVFPVYYTNEHGFQSSAVIYSDDNGETWNIGESPNDGRDMGNGVVGDSKTMSSGNQLTECQVVEMPNGQLKLFMRNTGSYVRIATSFDGGETWDAEVYEDRSLPEPYCQLSVINYSNQIDGQDAIVFANPKGAGRTNGTVRFGLITENGTHANGEPRYEFEWRYNKLVKPSTYAYSCLTELANGDIGLFYEGTGSEEMSYMEMSPEYIKFDYEASVEDLVNPAQIESVEVLGDKENYTPGENINIKLTFDQAVSLAGNKNLTLSLGEKELTLNPVSENGAREFVFEGKLPSDLLEGTYGFTLMANESTEILNTVGKNITLSSNVDLSEIGGQVVIAGETSETPDETPEENNKPLATYENIRIRNNNAVDITEDLESFKSLTEGTIIARFDNTNKAGVQSIIGIGNQDAANTHFHLYTYGDKVGFELRNGTDIAKPSANVTLNNGINTVAFKVTNGIGYKVFVNGAMVINVEDSNARFLDAVDNINKAYIGKTPRAVGQNAYSFNGDMDFVEIYGSTLEDEVLLSRTSETKLIDDLATEVSGVEIIDEKEEYTPGEALKIKVSFNQAVSLVGENNLILKVGESEVPVTIVRGDTASDFILEAILPEEITYGSHALTIKANENTSILNTDGNNITLSSDMSLNKSINIAGETPEVQAPALSLTVPQVVKTGEEFDVKVNIANVEEKYAMDFEVEYNDDKVELKNVASVVEDKYFVQHKVSDGKVRVIVASLGSPIDANADFIKLTFEAKEAGENVDFTTINSTVSDGDGNVVEVENAIASVNINDAVDKSALTEVIEAANELAKNEENKYTEASIKALNEAIALAQGVLDNEEATQEQVNVAKEAVQGAIDSLELVEKPSVDVDKTALKITIDYATELKEGGALEGVVEAVVTEFNKALANALNVYNNESSTVEEVKTAFDKLTLAIHMLEFKEGDKSELKNLIDSVSALDNEKYTEDSWANLEAILAKANKVYEDKNAMQEEVNEVAGKLQQALEDLEEKKVIDKSLLQNIVNMVKDTQEDKYIVSTWKPFNKALQNANNILVNEDASQKEVDDAYSALLKAYLGLRLTPDKSALEDLINKVNSLDLSNYTKVSVKALNSELKKANKVFKDEKATKEDIDTAVKNLETAVANLEPKSDNEANKVVANGGNNTNGNNSSGNNTTGGNSNNSIASNSSSSNKNSSNGQSKSSNLPKTGAAVSSTMTSIIAALSAIGGALMMKKKK